MQLELLSAAQLGHLVNTKTVSPTEVMNYFIDRVENRNASINAFTYTKYDEALEEAKKLEDNIMLGKVFGKFAGVPFGLKDFLDSKCGWTHSYGGVRSLVTIDKYDSEFCKAAEALGAIAVGKTNSPPFGFSGACQNLMYGATGNPFDITRTSGGSSGGSAAAVADGLLGFAEGGDAGGSIRIPAGWCNLFGFKPSRGTVPSVCRPDAWSATHPFCFNGALTRTVEDSAIIYSKMARYDPRDPMSLPIVAGIDFTQLKKSDTKFKIGFTLDFDLYPRVDADVYRVVTHAVKLLKDTGRVDVDMVRFNWKHSLDEILRCWAWTISVDTALDLDIWKSKGIDIIRDYYHEVPEEWVKYNNIAAHADIHDMRKFNEIRTDILDNFEDIFSKYDFIVSPTAVCKPMKLADGGRCKDVNGFELDPETNFISFGETPLANFTGHPSASIPAGFTHDGLPVGMQVIGKMFGDASVFDLAYLSETANPWNYTKSYNRM